jgi:hypothetical protein
VSLLPDSTYLSYSKAILLEAEKEERAVKPERETG